MPGVLLEGEKGWVLLKYREVVLSLDESGWGSRVTSCQETKNVLDRWKKSTSSLHKKTGQNSPPFTVSSLFAGSDTCHIWDSAGADEQGAGLVSHLTTPERAARRLPTDKPQDESKRGDRARLVSHHDKRQRLCENQRYRSDTLIARKPHNHGSFGNFLIWKFKGSVLPNHKNVFLLVIYLAMQRVSIFCAQAWRYLPLNFCCHLQKLSRK